MTAAPARTLFLTERVPHRCRLAGADVGFLQERHRRHLEVAPTGRRHLYRLTPRGYAGIIVTAGCRLVIRPKIPLENLFFLLDPTAPVPAPPDSVEPTAGDGVLDFLAGQLAAGITRRVAAGLHRGYREQAEHGPFLHGRLDMPAQIRAAPGGKEQLHGVTDDFTADVPCNQVLRLTAERLEHSPLVGEEVRSALRRSLAGLEGIRPSPPPEGWERLLSARLPEEYPPLLGLCRLLLDGLAPGESAGSTPVPAFLIDMERVWEDHVTRTVRHAFEGSGQAVCVQGTHTVGRDAEGQSIVMRPDVTLDREGRPLVIVDAKWKRLRGGVPPERDLYQVLAYCTTLGAARAVLVYPGRRDRAAEWVFDHTPIRVSLHTLRVEGSREACLRSARRLGRTLSGYTTPSSPPSGRGGPA